MVVFYKQYPYAPVATLVSVLSSVGAILAAIGAVFFFFNTNGQIGRILLAILLAALAVFLFVYVSRKLPDQMAEKESKQNILTKPRFAYLYCKEHPEAYESIAAENLAFADKYMRNEAGKIVKRK